MTFVRAEPQPSTSSEPQEDAKEILPGKAYHWHDWSICRGRDCLYIWSDSAALELSNGSNGWFRFILDGKLATMYSSGSPENGNDSSGELLLGDFVIFQGETREKGSTFEVLHAKTLLGNMGICRNLQTSTKTEGISTGNAFHASPNDFSLTFSLTNSICC
jgi:hypothetical protein